MTYQVEYKLDDRDTTWKVEGTYSDYEKAKRELLALVFDGYIVRVQEV